MQKPDVLIVGAGAAGIGMALTLQKVPGLSYGILERGRVGESFRRWPRQTRLLTPSFHGNPFGLVDLNAVDTKSSPALFAGAEHLSGEQYAQYLRSVAEDHRLPIISGCDVTQVDYRPRDGFFLETTHGMVSSRFLIWATGEYQFPDLDPFPGACHCPHYAQVEDWSTFKAAHHTVIGGFESGIDAAVNLVTQGKRVRWLIRKPIANRGGGDDPSLSLSPYSRERLQAATTTGRLELVSGADVTRVTQGDAGEFRIDARDGRHWTASRPPILGTGFVAGGGARQISELWDWARDGNVLVTDSDESTCTPGLFLVGPHVRHGPRIYCFIYKFRQRFGLIAENLAARMGLDTDALATPVDAWDVSDDSDCCTGCEC